MSGTPVLTCEDALRFLAAYLDGELDEATDHDVENHLARCRSCYSRSEFERRLKQQVAGLARAEVSPEFAARIQRLMQGFTTPPKATDS